MSSGSVKPCGLGLAANSRLELRQPTVLEFREDGDGRPVLALTEAWEQFLLLENAHSSLLAALAEFERSRDPLVGHPLALVVPGLANPRAFRTGGHPVCLNLKTIASFHSPAVTKRCAGASSLGSHPLGCQLRDELSSCASCLASIE